MLCESHTNAVWAIPVPCQSKKEKVKEFVAGSIWLASGGLSAQVHPATLHHISAGRLTLMKPAAPIESKRLLPIVAAAGSERMCVDRGRLAGSKRSSLLSDCPCLIVTSRGKRFPPPAKRCRLLLLLQLLIQLCLYSLPTPVPPLVLKKEGLLLLPLLLPPSLCFFFLILLRLPTACCLPRFN